MFGRKNGNIEAEEIDNIAGAKIRRHNVNSSGRMWDQVGKETGTMWKTWVELYDMDKAQAAWAEDGAKILRFEVKRVG